MFPLHTVVTFGKRRGYVVGYTTIERRTTITQRPRREAETYLVVELDPESADYLEKKDGYDKHDCFISVMVVHPQSCHEWRDDGV